MKLTRDHIAPDGQSAQLPAAVTPVYARFLIRFVMVWLAAGHPLRRGLRRILDMMQIYNLSVHLDVKRLAARAQEYSLKDMIASGAPETGMSLRGRALCGISAWPEIDRVSPRCAQTAAYISTSYTASYTEMTAKPRVTHVRLIPVRFIPACSATLCKNSETIHSRKAASAPIYNIPPREALTYGTSGVPP